MAEIHHFGGRDKPHSLGFASRKRVIPSFFAYSKMATKMHQSGDPFCGRNLAFEGRPMARIALSGLIISALFLLLGAARAQQPAQEGAQATAAPQAAPAPSLKVTTRMVVVDVIATDHKGQPITDLKQNEIAVYEDDKPQEIRSFSFEPGTEPADKRVSINPPPLQPGVVSNIREYGKAQHLSIVLLDGLNTQMDKQAYVKQQLLELLKKLPENGPVAVFLLGTRLRLLQDFTTDPEHLKQVIAGLKEYRSPLLSRPEGGPDKFWFEGLPMLPEMKRRALAFQQESESADTDTRVSITLAAFNALARTLAGYSGRKNLIWVSDTFPFVLVPTKVRYGGSADRARRDYSQVLAQTANLLADARISVYPVDAHAITGNYVYSPSGQYDTRGDPISQLRTAAQMGRALDDTTEELEAAHGTMREIAESTGGRALYNRNDLGNEIGEGMADGSAYYSLGYYPENRNWNGQFRHIKVKVSRPGVTVRYRLGYFASDPLAYAKQAAKVRDADFNAALDPELPAATALPFIARISREAGKDAAVAGRTLVTFLINARNLSFSEADGGTRKASAECAVRAFAVKSPEKPVLTEAETVNADLNAENYQKVMQSGLPCRAVVNLPAGEYVLRLAVRDNQTGVVGAANGQVVVR